MDETELERLIIRLVGDGSSYQKMCKDAVSQTQDAAADVARAGKSIEDFTNSLQGFASSALGLLSTLGVATSAWKAFEKFQEGEQYAIRMTAAIRMNTTAVDATIAQYGRFATAIMEVTTMTKGEVMGLLQKAETYGKTGDAAQQLVQQSIGLATATGIGNEQAMRAVMGMQAGNTQMLRMIPQLRMIHDEGQRVAMANRLMASGWETAQKLAETTSGKIEKLQRSLGYITKEVGGMISEAITPLVEWTKKAVDWFNQLDPLLKKLTVTVIGLYLGFRNFGTISATVMSVLSPLLGMLSAILSVGFLPLIAGAVAVAGVIAVVVAKFGSFGDAWKAIKDGAAAAWAWVKLKVQEFIAWVRPVWMALQGFLSVAWQIFSYAAVSVWETIKEVWETAKAWFIGVWEAVFGGASISWTKIRDTIRDVILFGEFTLRNFEMVGNFVWLAIKLGFVKAFETVRYYLLEVLPAWALWWKDNWQAVMMDVWNLSVTIFTNLAHNIIEIVSNLPGLISGSTDWSEVWRPLTEGFESAIGALPDIAERQMGETERAMQESLAAQQEAIATAFSDFRDQRIAEMTPSRNRRGTAEAQRTGQEMGAALNRGFGKEAGHLTAVLFGSAQAIKDIYDYKQLLNKGAAAQPQSPLQAATTGVISAINAASSGFKGLAGVGHGFFQGLRNVAGNVWNDIRGFAERAWSSIYEWAVGRLGEWVAWLQGRWEDFFGPYQAQWDSAVAQVTAAWNLVVDAAQGFWAWLVSVTQPIWDGIKSVWDTISGEVKATWDTIVEEATKFWNWLVGVVQPVWDRIQAAFNTVWTAIQQAWQPVQIALTATLGPAIVAIGASIALVKVGFDWLWDRIGGLAGVVQTARDGISALGAAVRDAIRNLNPANWGSSGGGGGGGGGGFLNTLSFGLLGRQLGGTVETGRAYLVGEAGPELFIPRVSGEITTASPVGEGGGEGGGDGRVEVLLGKLVELIGRLCDKPGMVVSFADVGSEL